ncbi:unnamed protein product [Polarella glacialis]|uniref:Pseudouridine synthase RsuA/RluA-like domain-containing protein n=1 Tax=Polarella glacialis TaxID=89957 RepID=A0A813KLC4_POLGL|nr:unnamed protein product [Polarella glacialis]
MDELLLVAWGSASSGLDPDLFRAIQDEVVSQLEDFEVGACPPLARDQFVQSALGVVWACNYAGLLDQGLLESARRVMKRIGVALDLLYSTAVPGVFSCHGLRVLGASGAPSAAEVDLKPEVVLDLPDRLVVMKPPHWEVHGQSTEFLQLLTFLQATLGGSRRLPILQDAQCDFGFLHRLDVPSSGLVLAAKTYEAYYESELQLRAGKIVRDYVVLCHGWVPLALEEINARVHWRPLMGDLPSSSGGPGKASRTKLKVLAYASYQSLALSLVAVRILTGRRHQIRSHFAHVGHPTACDGTYTASATFQSDLPWCTRNFLHRYRLAFKDSVGSVHAVVAAVPPDLASALLKLRAKDAESGSTVQLWNSGLGTRDWTDYGTLGGEKQTAKLRCRRCA